MQSGKIFQIILLTFFGMLGSILIGFIFYNSSIFIPTRTNFQFVMAGLYGSLFFSLLEYKGIREQLFAIIILLFLQVVIFTGRYLSMTYIIRDVFYLGSIFLSIKFYHQFIKRNSKIKYYLRSFALVLFYGIINTVFIIILFMISASPEFPPIRFIYALARDSVLVSLGIGLGIDFYLQNQKRLDNLLKTKAA